MSIEINDGQRAGPRRSVDPEGSAGVVAIDLLSSDLRTLAGLRSRTAVRDRPLPALDPMLAAVGADPDRRYVALQEVLGRAIGAVGDPDHRRAAAALLAFEAGRWRPLSRRGADAASVFGLGWDAYRRRRAKTGTSLLQETLHELALAIVYGSRSSGPGADGALASTADAAMASPAPSLDGPRPGRATSIGLPEQDRAQAAGPVPADRTRRWSRRSTLVAAALAIAIVAGTGAALFRPSETPSAPVAERQAAPATPATCGNLTHRVGAAGPASGPEVRAWVEPFRRAVGDLPAPVTRCAGFMEVQGNQIFERISAGNNAGAGSLVATADGKGGVVAMEPFEFYAFSQGELDPPDPNDRLGTPLRRVDRGDGTRVIELTSGVIVTDRVESPSLWITAAFWRRWVELGGLDGAPGRPLSQSYGVTDVGNVQDFEGGRLVSDFRTGDIRWEPITSAGLELPDDYRGAILVSPSKTTSWFVDLDGVRHWLPTDVDYRCARSAHAAEDLRDVPAAAIASLPAGEAFRCR